VAGIANSGVDTCTMITALRDRDFAKMQKLGKTRITMRFSMIPSKRPGLKNKIICSGKTLLHKPSKGVVFI